MNYEQLNQQHSAAKGEMSTYGERMGGLVKKLEDGIDLREACEVADRFWDAREAAEIKTRLFNSFPKVNGRVLLDKELDKSIILKIPTEETRRFFDASTVYIQTKLDQTLAHINSLGLDHEVAAEMMMALRKETARYLAFVTWGIYEIKAQLLDPAPKRWEDLSPTVDSVESGDYLFMENLGVLVERAHATFIEEHFPETYTLSLDNFSFRLGTIEAVMELAAMFSRYLHDMESKAGNKEVIA